MVKNSVAAFCSGEGPGGRVDDGIHASQGGRQTFPGDHVHPVRAGHRHHLVSLLDERVHDVVTYSPGCPGNRDFLR